jgi:nicotinamide-nucleotide amidase
MKCEIIAVGTELLLGNILNTNAKYLSEKLAELGLEVYYQTVVGDNLQRVSEAFKKGVERSDVVIATGGLGPTDDDLTKDGLCQALGISMLLHEPTLTKIESFFKSIDRIMPECNKRQAYIPVGSIILENNNGTAPGILLEVNGKISVLLPGPPSELIPMFENSVYPFFKARTNSILKSKMIRIVGVGESAVQEQLREIFDNQSNPTIAPYAKSGEVHLRITAKAETIETADKMLYELEDKVRDIIGNNVYGCDNESLEDVVIGLLQNSNKTISLAESCTGGLISQRLTNVSGASKCFMNGIVTYSNEAKQRFLRVKEDTLLQHGAVSSETAYEMAEGIKRVSGTDIGLAITGIAGPTGGTAEKPVGLCYIGLAYNDKVETFKLMFAGNREKIRWNASIKALDIVRRILI